MTLVGSTVISPSSRPDACGASATLTGTTLVWTSSSRTLTKAGSEERTVIRGSIDLTVTGTLDVPACGSTPDRSISAVNVSFTGLTSGGAK